MFLDKYSSSLLFKYLHEKKTGTCGLARVSEKKICQFPKLESGDSRVLNANNVMAMKIHDGKEITLLSTVHSGHIGGTGKVRRNGQTHYKPQLPNMQTGLQY